MDVFRTDSGGRMDWGALIDGGAFVVREISLFAAAGFLFLGASDLAVDFIWLGVRLRRALGLRAAPECAGSLPPPSRPGRLAIFVPAWDEAAVIGQMLRHALAAFAHEDFRIFVGCYPNDSATIAAVASIRDPRLRLVVGAAPGPTTKADCLNGLWEALQADEAAEGKRVKAVILHDAEDVIHSAELRLFDALIERFDLVQLPVLPLIDPGSRWIAGHYADEFAEAHGKELVVREALGAGLPSAGVGCAIARDALAQLAAASGGNPFDPASLTEDYELGLKLKALGRRGAFVRLPALPGGAAVATRGHFPVTLEAAINQKSRWMAGIALSGWDRLGWSGGLAERWMRLRDRQSLLAALILCAAYAALLMAAPLATLAALADHPVELVTPALSLMMTIATLLLIWRLAMRFGFVTRAYGWREGLRSIPRVLVGNAVAMLAARRALGRYRTARRTGAAAWGKTVHIFPSQLPAE
jgi:adsorption protein B